MLYWLAMISESTVFFDSTDLTIASVTLPQFKLCWLDDTGKD
jgi:hypothetical protein